MRTFILFWCGLVTLVSCSRNAVEKPSNLIDKEKMVAILYDFAVLESVRSQNIKGGISPQAINAYVFTKHKIDSLQFVRSNRYYAADATVYQKMFEEVKMKLETEKLKTVPEKAATLPKDTTPSAAPAIL